MTSTAPPIAAPIPTFLEAPSGRRWPVEGISDPQYLRGAVDALSAVMDELDGGDGVGWDETGADLPYIAGFRAAYVITAEHRQAALTRLGAVLGPPRPARPVVIDPRRVTGPVGLSTQGQPLVPLITAGAAPTFGLSSAQVWMPPHHTSFAHVHHHTGVGVLVLQGSAITLWWDEFGDMHELPQVAGQHLYIPHGVPHAAINPHEVPVVAAEFRSNAVFNADNQLLPDLDPLVAARVAGSRGEVPRNKDFSVAGSATSASCTGVPHG